MGIVLDGKTIGDADVAGLAELKRRVQAERRIPKRLRVDGRELDLQRFAGLQVAGATEVDLETVSLGDSVGAAYASVGECLPRLEADLARCCDDLLLGRLKEAMQTFAGACVTLNTLFALMGPLESLLGHGADGTWSARAGAVSPLFKSTQESMAQGDWVLVGDQ